jgi:predicted enzyme related to lactoylglutathione lyase
MPTRDSVPLGAPIWVDLMTSNPDGARAFYGEIFGWASEDAGEAFGHYINFAKDGVPIAGGMQKQDPMMPDLWSVYLHVTDADATADAATAAGAQVLIPPMPVADLGKMAVLVDPSGAAIGMWQPGTMSGFGLIAETGAPSWIELQTRDYDKAVEFYKSAFKWDAYTMGDTPDFRYTTLGENEDAVAGIMDASGFLPEGIPSHWAIYFGTEDTDKSVERVVELGGTVVQPPTDSPYGRMAACLDPTGALFKLIDPSKAVQPG